MNGFAAAQLKKFGWQEGKGLGRLEDGVTEPIKPKLKFNTSGLSYDPAEEFKFHWWDHVFNKAAKNIDVEAQNGSVEITRKEELRVSKKLETATTTNTLYHGFMKGGILNKGKMDSDDSDSDSDTDTENIREKDMSRTLTDEELFKLCGGRTAHKGARHGLNMSAKLARVQEQERKLMEGWKKSEEKSWEPEREVALSEITPLHPVDLLQDDVSSQKSDEREGKKKSKKRKEKDIEDVNEMTREKKKKKKKKREDEELPANDICCDNQHSKKKKKAPKECPSESGIYEEENTKAEEVEPENEDSGKSKKKKKKKKNKEIYEEQVTCNSFDEQSSKKKKKSHIEREEESSSDKHDENRMEKRKKKKKRKHAEEQENDVE